MTHAFIPHLIQARINGSWQVEFQGPGLDSEGVSLFRHFPSVIPSGSESWQADGLLCATLCHGNSNKSTGLYPSHTTGKCEASDPFVDKKCRKSFTRSRLQSTDQKRRESGPAWYIRSQINRLLWKLKYITFFFFQLWLQSFKKEIIRQDKTVTDNLKRHRGTNTYTVTTATKGPAG